MTDLIARLESAEGPSRELDAEIALAVGYDTYPDGYGEGNEWVAPDGARLPRVRGFGASPPKFTSSVDAALTLVPEGMRWCVDTCDGKPRSFVEPSHPYEGQPFWGNASTPALALVIAALRAKGVE